MKKGTTLECFEDLMGQLQSLPEYYELRKQFAKVIGVEDQTVQRWITGSSTPYGVSMIGLRSYLDFLGYDVTEFSAISAVMREASRLLAFRVVTLDKMATFIGFPDHNDQVLAILRGVRGVSKERHELFQRLVEENRFKLRIAVSNLTRVIPEERSESAPAAKEEPVIEQKLLNGAERDEHFKWLTLMLLSHARYYTGRDVSEDVRDHLRTVVGQRNIFDLKNLLVRLCGSTAFSQPQP